MELFAKERNLKTDKVKSLRSEGHIPGIVFSKKTSQGKEETVPVSVNLNDFLKVYAEAGESTLISLKTDKGNGKEVLISDLQVDPISLEPIHVSLYEVDMTQEISAHVPVEVINEDEHPKVKSKEALIITILNEIEVTCLPKDLPSEFTVDALALNEIGDVLTVEEAIKYDKEKLELGVEPEEVLIKLDYAEQPEIEVEEEEMGVEDVEVATAKEGEEGEEGESEGSDEKEDSSDEE